MTVAFFFLKNTKKNESVEDDDAIRRCTIDFQPKEKEEEKTGEGQHAAVSTRWTVPRDGPYIYIYTTLGQRTFFSTRKTIRIPCSI